MIERLRNQYLRIAVGALYALAMMLAVYAHQPLAAAPDIDLSAYSLPDGSAPALCLDASGSETERGTAPATGQCDACRLTVAPGLPAQSPAFTPCGWLRLERTAPVVVQIPLFERFHSAPPARSPPARGATPTPA